MKYRLLFSGFLLFFFFILAPLFHKLAARERYELPAGKVLIELSLEIARSQIGISDAKNPERVRDYLKAAGVGYYNPFCASGQYWCLVQAKKQIESFNKTFGTDYSTTLPYPRSALANYPYNYAKKHGIKTNYTPHKHDLLIWIYGNGPNGHIERIDSVMNCGWVRCIGFNTGNREVKYTKRNIHSPIGRRRVRGLVGSNSNQCL